MHIRSRYHASKRLYPKANFVLVAAHEDRGDGGGGGSKGAEGEGKCAYAKS